MDVEKIREVPAPWRLNGRGYVLFFRFGSRFRNLSAPRPPHHLGKLRLSVGAVMVVDYRDSDVGPYQELLIMPGLYQYGWGFYPSITKIYVSSDISIINGRRNWGIPKEKATFGFSNIAQGLEKIHIANKQGTIAELELKTFGPRMPINTVLIPSWFRTVVQPYESTRFKTVLQGKGRMRLSRIMNMKVNPNLFPDFSQALFLGGVAIEPFELIFPVPETQPIQ